MRIGIDLYDLKPNMKQGINVYSESLVNGFLNLKEKFTLQLYVNKDYLKYARSKFKSKKTNFFSYEQKNQRFKGRIIKIIIYCWSFFGLKSLKIFALINNYIFKDFKKLIENNSDILISPNVILNHYNLNIKTVLCIHDIQHVYFPQNFSKYEITKRYLTRNNSVRSCDYLIASSNFLKKQLYNFFKKKKNSIKVISEGVDLSLFKKKNYINRIINNIKLPKKFIFYPSQFWPHKNHLLLLKAVYNLKKKNKKINIVFCGGKKNYFNTVMNYINKNKLSTVIYLGNIQLKNVIKAYNLCTAVVMPSVEESSSLVLKESVAIGKPFLAAKTNTFKEKSKEFKIKTFDINKISDFENKISYVYANSLKHKKNVTNNSKKIKNYQWQYIAKKFYTLVSS